MSLSSFSHPKYIVPTILSGTSISYWIINEDHSFTTVYKDGEKNKYSTIGNYEKGIQRGYLREVTKEELALII